MRTPPSIVHFITFAAISGIAGFVAGCGPSGPAIGRVSGTVTLDSQPLQGAIITFHPDQGRESRGYTDENGRYELSYTRDTQGALVGAHTVRISTSSEHAPKERLPARYNAQSGLTEEVTKGANTINFDLRSGS